MDQEYYCQMLLRPWASTEAQLAALNQEIEAVEKEMWMGLKDIAVNERYTVHDLCTSINQAKKKLQL